MHRTIGAKAIHGLPPNYKDLIADPDKVCDACIFAKNKMRPYHSGCCTFQHHGEMLHIDLHEKSTLSYHNNKYSISIIEDYSGCDLSQFRVGACSLVVNLTMSNSGGVSSNPSFSILEKIFLVL